MQHRREQSPIDIRSAITAELPPLRFDDGSGPLEGLTDNGKTIRVNYHPMYAGSVTAPPCTEGVTWFVMKTPVEISAAQIAEFARRYPYDARPVQPLNGRVVKATR